MPNPIIREHNQETNQVIDREMTDAEYAQFQELNSKMKAIQAEAETNATAKAALLAKLGITADEAALLLA